MVGCIVAIGFILGHLQRVGVLVAPGAAHLDRRRQHYGTHTDITSTGHSLEMDATLLGCAHGDLCQDLHGCGDVLDG